MLSFCGLFCQACAHMYVYLCINWKRLVTSLILVVQSIFSATKHSQTAKIQMQDTYLPLKTIDTKQLNQKQTCPTSHFPLFNCCLSVVL